MDLTDTIASGARAVAALGPALTALEECPQELAAGREASARGHFTPAQDECIRMWLARYLTAREALLEIIGDLAPAASGRDETDEPTCLRAFVVAYTAASMLVRTGHFLVDVFAADKLVQRKLNEAEPRYRIPPKQYTVIFESLTDPANGWRLHQAMRFAELHRASIDGLTGDEILGPVVDRLRVSEGALRVPARTFIKARLRYRLHSLRRRRASASQKVLFAIAEAFGRTVAEVGHPFHVRGVTPELCSRVEPMLLPGDVIITRRDLTLSNLFLPGYWPHAALYVGPAADGSRLGIDIDADRAARWVEPLRVLEARKDGVRLRALDDTLSVDAFAIIRPTLEPAAVSRALTQALSHEGKLYNFDFDFFRADRLVCTEVVYRAYDGLGVSFLLRQRGGRPTLSAEDLLDMALECRGFAPFAVYGAPSCPDQLVVGPEAAEALASSYRHAAP